MGLCIRPFGILIAGDRDCHERHDQIKRDKQAHNEAMAWAHSSGDGQTPIEGVIGDAFGFLGGVVGSDPLSQLLSGLGAKKDATTGAVDATPLLLLGAVGVVGAVIFLTAKKGK